MSVYFVTCREANAVKIGSSLEPRARLGEIQWGCPLELKLEAVLPGNQEEEFAFHVRFSDLRLRGEWFTINEMIEAIIAANPPPAVATDEKPQVTREQLHKAARRRKFLEEQEAIRQKGARLNTRLLTSDQRRRIASGDIHFPFRATEAA